MNRQKKVSKSRRLVVMLFIYAVSWLFLAGCWDNRDIETLAMVVAIGIDQEAAGQPYLITFQIVRPGLIGTTSEGTNTETQATWNISVEGESIFDAVRRLRAYTPRDIFFGHTQLVIFGEEMAKRGVGQVLDFIQRETKLRRTVRIAVAKGEAKSILEARPALEVISGISLIKTLDFQERYSLNFTQIMGNFVADIDRPTGVAVAPGVARVGTAPQDEQLSEHQVEETAVFRDDRLVAWLDERESIGLLWFRGLIRDASIIFPDPVDDTNKVNVEVTRSRTDFQVRVENGIPVFTIKVNSEGKVASQTSSHDLYTPDVIAVMNKRAANTVKDRIMQTVAKSQELQLDFLDLGKKLSQRQPAYWRQVEDNWEELLPKAVVIVDSRFKIRKSGLIIKSIRFGEQ